MSNDGAPFRRNGIGGTCCQFEHFFVKLGQAGFVDFADALQVLFNKLRLSGLLNLQKLIFN